MDYAVHGIGDLVYGDNDYDVAARKRGVILAVWEMTYTDCAIWCTGLGKCV